jgi:hypothetical protein
MTPKELANHYGAKIFDAAEAAKAAGFVVTTRMSPRNVWNKASAAQAIMFELRKKLKSEEAAEIGLILEPFSVTGCYLPRGEKSVPPAVAGGRDPVEVSR